MLLRLHDEDGCELRMRTSLAVRLPPDPLFVGMLRLPKAGTARLGIFANHF